MLTRPQNSRPMPSHRAKVGDKRPSNKQLSVFRTCTFLFAPRTLRHSTTNISHWLYVIQVELLSSLLKYLLDESKMWILGPYAGQFGNILALTFWPKPSLLWPRTNMNGPGVKIPWPCLHHRLHCLSFVSLKHFFCFFLYDLLCGPLADNYDDDDIIY